MGEKICHLKPVTRKRKINAANFFMQGMFQEVPYNQKVFQDCDVCDMWFHFHCVDISDEKKKTDENDSCICCSYQFTLQAAC